jgi:hypothetical protein
MIFHSNLFDVSQLTWLNNWMTCNHFCFSCIFWLLLVVSRHHPLTQPSFKPCSITDSSKSTLKSPNDTWGISQPDGLTCQWCSSPFVLLQRRLTRQQPWLPNLLLPVRPSRLYHFCMWIRRILTYWRVGTKSLNPNLNSYSWLTVEEVSSSAERRKFKHITY